MPKSIPASARKLAKILNQKKRATITAEWFRELVGRHRIEDSFLLSLNSHSIEYHSIAVNRVGQSKFLLSSTIDRYLDEDPYAPSGRED
ncbi:MAG: hypothetical protein ACLQJ7_02050 [Syntrophobacteraceae bacterium]